MKGENQAIKTSQINGVLTLPAAFEGMTAETGQSGKFIDVVRMFDNIDALNEFAPNLLPISFNGQGTLTIFPLQFPRSKSNSHTAPFDALPLR